MLEQLKKEACEAVEFTIDIVCVIVLGTPIVHVLMYFV